VPVFFRNLLGNLYKEFGPQKIDSKKFLSKREFFKVLDISTKTVKRPPSPTPEHPSGTL
jgi:hypothetical protein